MKNDEKSRLEGVLGALGRGLAPILAFRVIRDSKNRFVDHLLRFRKVAQGSKMEPKSSKNIIKNETTSYNRFESIFCRFWEWFLFQKPLQNEGY